MKRPVELLSMIAAVWLATPAAMAGTDIVKCVDPQGHVTLTDQPCASGATGVRVVSGADYAGSASSGSSGSAGSTGSGSDAAPTSERHVLPAVDARRPAWQRPPSDRAAPLARDIATLKEARRALQLMEGLREGPRPRLAGLQ